MKHQYRRIVLMAMLFAVLSCVHAIRVSDAPVLPRAVADQQPLLLERQVGFGDTGPAWRQQIKRQTFADLQEALGPTVGIIPFGLVDTFVKDATGQAVSLRVLDTDIGIDGLLQDSDTKTARECGHDRVRFTERQRQRLGLTPGQWVQIGGDSALIGADIPDNATRLLPGIEDVNAIRCVSDPFAKKAAPVEQALLIGRGMSEAELGARLALLIRDDGHFKEHWRALSLNRAAELAGQRRLGWMLGLEWLIAILAVGALVLLRALEEVGRSGDHAIRRALGERIRHRIRRHLASVSAEGAWILLMGLPIIVSGLWLLTKMSSVGMPHSALLPLALPILGACAAALVGLRLVVDLALDTIFTRQQVGRSSTRVSRRSHPALAAIGLAALLCGAICVPAAFMIAEFDRHAQMSSGYRTEGLYAVRLTLLDYDHRDQRQWWDRLDALRGDVTQMAGVTAAGYITPAPWNFTGTKGVVANENDMILNVAVTNGVLRMLSPVGWNGREMIDQEKEAESIVQNLKEDQRRNFIPKGNTIVGEIRGLRYSPLDETGRPAIFRSLRTGIGYDVNLLVEAVGNEAAVIDGLNAVLARHGEIFAAAPAASIDRILSDRLSAVRTSAIVSMTVATIALVLLGVTLLAAIRLYVALNRRDLSIRLCLGAPAMRVQATLLGRSLAAISLGWGLGTMAGLALWHQIVVLIRDHRLVQPWSSGWLWVAALLLIVPYIWYLARIQLRRIPISEALKG